MVEPDYKDLAQRLANYVFDPERVFGHYHEGERTVLADDMVWMMRLGERCEAAGLDAKGWGYGKQVVDGLREPTWEHDSEPDWKEVAKGLAVALDFLASGVVDPRKAAKWPMVQAVLDNYYRALKE